MPGPGSIGTMLINAELKLNYLSQRKKQATCKNLSVSLFLYTW